MVILETEKKTLGKTWETCFEKYLKVLRRVQKTFTVQKY